MITCINCKKPLKLKIDMKDKKCYCSQCDKNYDVVLKKNHMIISSSRKKSKIYLGGINISRKTELNKKTIYSFYKEGFITCIKTYNSKYYDHDSDWMINTNKVITLSINRLKKEKKSLKKEITKIKNSEQKYLCPECGTSFCFDEASKNNFSCFICKGPLEQVDNEKLVKNHKKNINNIKKKIIALKNHVS